MHQARDIELLFGHTSRIRPCQWCHSIHLDVSPDSASRAFWLITNAAELVRIDMDSEGGLGGTSKELFGPLAIALVGFQPLEVDRFRTFMNDMEADMVKVSLGGMPEVAGCKYAIHLTRCHHEADSVARPFQL